MSWQLGTHSNTVSLAYSGILIANNWVFRGMEEVFGWNKTADDLAWKTTLSGDNWAGPKLVVGTAGLAITFADYGRNEGSLFVGVSPERGDIVWENRSPFRPNKQGLAAMGDTIVCQGIQAKEYRLLLIDGNTGQELANLPSVPGECVLAAGQAAFVVGWKGVWKAQVQDVGLEQVTEGEAFSAISREDQVYVLIEEPRGVFSVVWLDARTSQEKKRVPSQWLTDESSALCAVGSDRVVITAGEEEGIFLLDLETGETVWRVGAEDGWTGYHCVQTPHGLIVVIEDREGLSKAVCLDESTGELSGEIATQYSPEHIFWGGQDLIVTSQEGMEAFCWQH